MKRIKRSLLYPMNVLLRLVFRDGTRSTPVQVTLKSPDTSARADFPVVATDCEVIGYEYAPLVTRWYGGKDIVPMVAGDRYSITFRCNFTDGGHTHKRGQQP